jgi:DNA-directed RNA polymerase specialized sigma24 family protein
MRSGRREEVVSSAPQSRAFNDVRRPFELVEHYWRPAPAVRKGILAIVRHHKDTDDAMQGILRRAYENLERFRQACKFSTWITAIGVNAGLTC